MCFPNPVQELVLILVKYSCLLPAAAQREITEELQVIRIQKETALLEASSEGVDTCQDSPQGLGAATPSQPCSPKPPLTAGQAPARLAFRSQQVLTLLISGWHRVAEALCCWVAAAASLGHRAQLETPGQLQNGGLQVGQTALCKNSCKSVSEDV